MQISIKIRYRSKDRVIADLDKVAPVLATTGTPSEPLSLCNRFSSADSCAQRESGRGVNAVNHFVDPPRKLPEPGADASSSPIGVVLANGDNAIQLDQIPIEEVAVDPSSRIFVHTNPRSAAADRFRFLRMCLRELWNVGKLRSLQITSALAQDGKSTIALNLATALAEGGKRNVLLIEADLHRPALTEHLRIDTGVGLADCLESGAHPASALRKLDPLGWYLLPAGAPRSNPTELLQTEAFAGVLQKLSPLFDWILIDSPPVIPLTDALSLARQANATLLVAREGHTPREAIEKAIAILGRQRVVGIVLNAVDGLEKTYSGYYGYNELGARDGIEAAGRPSLKGALDPPKR